MYKGFNLKLDDISSLSNDSKYSDKLKDDKKKITKKFDDLMLSDGYLDAEELIKEWFPKDEYHVFISHSHKDTERAECLANWLYENFKLKAFIDSHVWGYANILLKKLNDRFAIEDEKTYKYSPAISNAAHVHLMLSTALSEVIDKSECLFFINTENTLQNITLKDGSEEQRTASPWIMSELKTFSIIEKKLSGNRDINERKMILESISEGAKFLYKTSKEHLSPLSVSDLKNWLNKCKNTTPDQAPFFNRVKDYSALTKLYDNF